jgi:hypothetical protein
VLTPELIDVVREAYWIAIIWVISHESHFPHIRPKMIAVRLAKLVIEQVRNGARDPEKVSVSVLKMLRAERLINSQADTNETTLSFRDDNSSDGEAERRNLSGLVRARRGIDRSFFSTTGTIKLGQSRIELGKAS